MVDIRALRHIALTRVAREATKTLLPDGILLRNGVGHDLVHVIR